ncbi:hypothetical protein [Zobellella aerophila]|uniref:Uncharacterized protein n=1 Tax=Zobellella aerophila TaxID=870480 RepID=A0ABP6W3T6_9GAMM
MQGQYEWESLLWDEYKYRHDHIWKKLFQITIGVVLLGAVPYLKPDITRVLQGWILIAPLLGTVLSLIAIFLMHFELCLFAKIAQAHRHHQEAHGAFQHSKGSYFRYLIMVYVCFLFLVSIANVAVVRLLWLGLVA